jgi:hypothetical protein
MYLGYRVKYRTARGEVLWLVPSLNNKPVRGGECGVFRTVREAKGYAARQLGAKKMYQVWCIYLGDDPATATPPVLIGTINGDTAKF